MHLNDTFVLDSSIYCPPLIGGECLKKLCTVKYIIKKNGKNINMRGKYILTAAYQTKHTKPFLVLRGIYSLV